jgi:methionine biosynthesis protein MetW
MNTGASELEYRIILNLVPPGSAVLDLGCGDGRLLSLLAGRGCRAQGIEIDEKSIYTCVSRGISVLHGDIDSGLAEYSDTSFDYVILYQTFQQVKKPDIVLREALRVGKHAIVGFPNFAHYKARCQMFFRGKTPVTPSLPYAWFDTPNLHFLSLSDFSAYCRRQNIRIDKAVFTSVNGRVNLWPNLLALNGIFLLANRTESASRQ